MSEDAFLAWLRSRVPPPDPSVLVGDGPDDCAHLRLAGGGRLAVTTDTLLEGTHFTPEDDPAAVGWKALAVNLSDLAASACRARWFLVAAGWRRGAAADYPCRFMEGVLECAARYRVDLVGGDTTSGDGPASVTITALGEPLPGGPLLRSGARAGDLLVVTGRLGGSLLGRHLKPEPRLDAVAALLELSLHCAPDDPPLHAAMDLSDGLGLDASRLLAESGVSGILRLPSLPVSDAAVALSRKTGEPPWRHALSDGEDFELLMAIDPSHWSALAKGFAQRHRELPRTVVGEVRAGSGLTALDAGDRPVDPGRWGYQHAF